MARDQFVLIDETGVAVLSGTIQEMLDLKQELNSLGFDKIEIRRINEIQGQDND